MPYFPKFWENKNFLKKTYLSLFYTLDAYLLQNFRKSNERIIDVSRSILVPVYRYGRPNNDTQTLK